MRVWTVTPADVTDCYARPCHLGRYFNLAALRPPVAGREPPWVAALAPWNHDLRHHHTGPATFHGLPVFVMLYRSGRHLYLGRCGDDTDWQ